LHSSKPTISEKLKNSHLIGVLFCKKLSKILLRFYSPTIREISRNSLKIGFFLFRKSQPNQQIIKEDLWIMKLRQALEDLTAKLRTKNKKK
jgi:hypothetical protein